MGAHAEGFNDGLPRRPPMEEAADMPPAEARRLKWLFAIFLCPLCGLGFLWSVGALSLGALGAALLSQPWIAVAFTLAAVGVVVAMVQRRRSRRAA